MITCAKGIANGFPMGAVLIAPHIEATYGMLGTTFGGNHLGCAAALAVLDVMENEDLVTNAAKVGAYLLDGLKQMQTRHPQITDVRGKGLMIGIEFDRPIKEMRQALVKKHHLFTGAASTNILRLLPPLSLKEADAAEALRRIETAVNEM